MKRGSEVEVFLVVTWVGFCPSKTGGTSNHNQTMYHSSEQGKCDIFPSVLFRLPYTHLKKLIKVFTKQKLIIVAKVALGS